MTDLLTHPTPKTLGAFIRARSCVLGLEQKNLAEKLGSSQATVSLLTSNKRKPSLAMLQKLAKALKVDVQTLVAFVVK